MEHEHSRGSVERLLSSHGPGALPWPFRCRSVRCTLCQTTAVVYIQDTGSAQEPNLFLHYCVLKHRKYLSSPSAWGTFFGVKITTFRPHFHRCFFNYSHSKRYPFIMFFTKKKKKAIMNNWVSLLFIQYIPLASRRPALRTLIVCLQTFGAIKLTADKYFRMASKRWVPQKLHFNIEA